MDNIIQVRLPDNLKRKLDIIAGNMEVPVSTLIRMILASFSRQPQQVKLTLNGFTIDEEERILQSIADTEKAVKEKKAEVYKSIDEALETLKKEI